MKRCHKCGKEWTHLEQPGFKAACPGCESYLHACVNCKLYNPSADRCSSITAECTGDREGVTYCEEFQFRDAPNNANHRNGRTSRAANPNAADDASLRFGRGPRTSGPGRASLDAKKKFDDLFGK
ncbi:MAG TPA: hypothetical protein VMZ92_20725 [Planctomycetota bacterium]|nr:hypothetical protein [Planctomycetota bacterium]